LSWQIQASRARTRALVFRHSLVEPLRGVHAGQ
jgi:hypothetical protein